MRSFEERIAEINRRSDKIIKERKKRRKLILTACIPVILGTALLIALFPWDPASGETLKSRGSAAKVTVIGTDCYRYHSGKNNVMQIYDQLQAIEQHESKEDAPTEAPSNGAGSSGGSLNTGNSNGAPCDDPIYEGTQPEPEDPPMGAAPPVTSVPNDPYDDSPMHSPSPDDSFHDYPMDAGPSPDVNFSKPSEDTSYYITLTLPNGRTAKYLLTGNTLKNLTTDQETDLMDHEVEELKALLGISGP